MMTSDILSILGNCAELKILKIFPFSFVNKNDFFDTLAEMGFNLKDCILFFAHNCTFSLVPSKDIFPTEVPVMAIFKAFLDHDSHKLVLFFCVTRSPGFN